MDDSSVDVGKRLKLFRNAHGLSQRELAKRTGMTHGTISMIEQNKISPSIGSLKKLLDGLSMTVAEFFVLELSSEMDVFFSKDEMLEIVSGDLSILQVGADMKGKALQILYERYLPGGETVQAPYSHSGEEGGIVIEGEVELTVGTRVRVLGPGDGYHFNSRIPHRFRNTSAKECRIVSACSPPL